MKKIVLIAKASFDYPYGRKHLNVGDTFEAETERDAHMLCVTGRAMRAEEKQDKPRGTYNRRDLQATETK